MACTRSFKFFTAVNAVAMALAVVGYANAEDVATHKVVALRSGTGGLYGLFQSNSELSTVFNNELPGVPADATTPGGVGNTGNITVIDNAVDDTVLIGLADRDSSGIEAAGSNTWDDAFQFGQNNGTTPNSQGPGSTFRRMSLLKFDVAAAAGLSGGTIAKAELRLFFDNGAGPSDGDIFFPSRLPGEAGEDKVGRITTFDWSVGNKNGQAPGVDILSDPNDPNSPIGIPGAKGVTRRHPDLANTTTDADINDVQRQRTSGRWFDPDGVTEATGDPNNPLIYRTVIGSDYNNDAFVNGDDLERWEDNYGSNTPPDDGYSGFVWKLPLGDGDLNGVVNGKDFLAWQRNAGKVAVGLFGADPNFNEGGLERGWFGTENQAGDIPYSAPSWGDGNDLFNPYPVDYTAATGTNFPLVTIDGVQIYSPRLVGDVSDGNSSQYPVSPIDGVSPGDGDVATETDSLDDSSIGFTASTDYAGGFSENDPIGDVGPAAGFDVWDITTIVQAWADGTAPNYGLYLANTLREIAMSETPHGLDFAPVLFIEYTTAGAVAAVPEPASLVLLGLAGLAGLVRRRRRA